MPLWQVNCGSTVAISGWNNDANPDPTTLTNLVTSSGGASTAGWYCDVWDISKTDGIGHADLPAAVGASYLKWWGAGRTLRFTALDNAKTYTVTLYSTAPGAVSNNWTVAGSTKALARGGKATWSGLTPASGILEFVSASSTNGTDVTLSAALLQEDIGAIAGTGADTLAALTSSGSGSHTDSAVSGAGSSTLAALSSDGSGSFVPAAISGAGAATLAALSSGGAGTADAPAISGAAGAVLEALSAAGEGIHIQPVVGVGAAVLEGIPTFGVGEAASPVGVVTWPPPRVRQVYLHATIRGYVPL